jgi:hypothetical protein
MAAEIVWKLTVINAMTRAAANVIPGYHRGNNGKHLENISYP